MFDCDAVLSGAALFSVVAVLSVLAVVSGGLTYVTSGPPTPYGPGLCVPNGRIPMVSSSALSNPTGIATTKSLASLMGLGKYSGFHGVG